MTHPLQGRKQSPEHIKNRLASWVGKPRKFVDLRTKLFKKIDKTESCWIWVGSIFKKSTGSYGQIRVGRRSKSKLLRAHRVVYELLVGPIPKGLELDHLCRNTLCVNPDHLEAVTHAENMKRRKDSNLSHCRHGHLYTAETTYLRPDNGRRECKVCQRNRVIAFHSS
jgi:hypothetical protein